MTLRVEIIATLPLDEDQCERGLDARPIRQTWSGHDRLDGGHRGVNAVHPSEFLGARKTLVPGALWSGRLAEEARTMQPDTHYAKSGDVRNRLSSRRRRPV